MSGAPTRSQWAAAAVLVVATRVVFAAVAAAGARLAGTPAGLGTWRRWDADLYLKIAEHGYHGEGTDAWAEAFLPLWPLLVRGVAATGVPLLVAALLLTTVASTVAVAYLLRFGDEQAGAGSGRRAAVSLLVFPTAVFLIAPYSEALFLAGAIPALHHARRGEWAPAGVAAAVAAGTRLVGVFLLFGLLVAAIRRRPDAPERRRAAAALVAGVAPLAGYLGWLTVVRGSPGYLLTAQQEGWGRRLEGPVEAFTTTLAAARGADGWLAVTWPVELVAAAIGVAAVAVAVRRREWDTVAYEAPTLAVLLVSSWYYSIPRILLTFFPAFVHLAAWSGRRPRRHDLVVLVSAPLATVGVLAFTRGAWFF